MLNLMDEGFVVDDIFMMSESDKIVWREHRLTTSRISIKNVLVNKEND